MTPLVTETAAGPSTRGEPRRLLPVIGWVAVAESAGVIGSLATAPAVPAWYATLLKPSWTPPAWLFGPVWVLLYALIGTAAALVWTGHRGSRGGRASLAFFTAHLALNASWSFLFFGLRSPGLGLVGIGVLWTCILVLVLWWWRIERPAALLVVPYFAWVSYAAALNAVIWRLNLPG
jgi:benzodiazapine receptor